MNGMKNMQVAFNLFVLAACLSKALSGTHPDGVSKVSREQDAVGNYKFSYAVSNGEGEHFREEGTDHLGRVIGTYGLTHKDGTSRVVDYVADKDGFRAEVRSNEPGLASSETADASILKLQDGPLVVAASAIDNTGRTFGSRLNAETSRVAYVSQEEDKTIDQERLDNAAKESRQANFDDYRPQNPVAYYPDRPAGQSQRDYPSRSVDLPNRYPGRETDSTRPYPERQADSIRPLSERGIDSGRPYPDRNTDSFRPYHDRDSARTQPDSIAGPPRLYPGRPSDSGRALSSHDEIGEKLKTRDPTIESRPLDIYIPPINPNAAVRRPPYFDPDDRITDRYRTTSRRPYTPPYGGFDDDSSQLGRRPDISMGTLHGGFDKDDFHSPQTSTPAYGSGRFPSGNIPLSRDLIRPIFPPASNIPSSPRLPGSLFPTPQRKVPPGPLFGPPISYDPVHRNPNFVLRAIPIPNGIQAVRVDPETGRVHERVMYPLFLGQDGRPEYDRNVLLHNDEFSDDAALRNDNPSYLDMPYRRRLPFRSARTTPFNFDEEFGNSSRAFNQSIVDPETLSIPTARDLSWIQRQLELVEGFDRSRFPNPSLTRNSNFDNSEYPLFNDFDDSSDESPDKEDSPYSRSRNSDRPSGYSRNSRIFEGLQSDDTKNIIVSETKDVSSDITNAETDSKPDVLVKNK